METRKQKLEEETAMRKPIQIHKNNEAGERRGLCCYQKEVDNWAVQR